MDLVANEMIDRRKFTVMTLNVHNTGVYDAKQYTFCCEKSTGILDKL